MKNSYLVIDNDKDLLQCYNTQAHNYFDGYQDYLAGYVRIFAAAVDKLPLEIFDAYPNVTSKIPDVHLQRYLRHYIFNSNQILDQEYLDFINYVESSDEFKESAISYSSYYSMPEQYGSNYVDILKLPIVFSLSTYAPLSYNLDDLPALNQIFSIKDISDSVPYPIAVRHISKNNLYYIERPPFQIDVDMTLGRAGSSALKLQPCKIWVPWTITVVNANNFNSCKVYFGNGPSDSPDTVYSPCSFPNTYSDGSICFSNSLSDMPVETVSALRYQYSMIINEYYSGGWNLDLSVPFYDKTIYTTSSVEKDSLLYQHVHPTKETLKERFPDLSDSKISQMIRYINSNSSVQKAKYFFAMMSSYTLQETLDIYSQISKDSFDDLLSKETTRSYNEANLHSLRQNLYNNISSNHYIPPFYDQSANDKLNIVVIPMNRRDFRTLDKYNHLSIPTNLIYEILNDNNTQNLNDTSVTSYIGDKEEFINFYEKFLKVIDEINETIISNNISDHIFFLDPINLTFEYYPNKDSNNGSFKEFIQEFVQEFCMYDSEQIQSESLVSYDNI